MKIRTILNRLIIEPMDIPKPSKKIISLDHDKYHKPEEGSRVRIGRVMAAGSGGMDFNKDGKYVQIPMQVKVGDVVIFYQAAVVPIVKDLQDKYRLPYLYIIAEPDVMAILDEEDKEDKKRLRIK